MKFEEIFLFFLRKIYYFCIKIFYTWQNAYTQMQIIFWRNYLHL